MSKFFEPPPSPWPEQAEPVNPPPWTGRPQGQPLGAAVSELLLARSEHAAVYVDYVDAYPEGFERSDPASDALVARLDDDLSERLVDAAREPWRATPGDRARGDVHCLEGSTTLLLGEPPEKVEVLSGSVVVVPVGTPIQLINEGDQDSLVLVVGDPPSSHPAGYLPDRPAIGVSLRLTSRCRIHVGRAVCRLAF